MKRALFLALFAASCASSQQSTGPQVEIALTQLNNPANVFYYPGPVAVQYELSVTNPLNEPITLKRLDLSTSGQGAYALNTSGTLNLKIPAKSTATQTISAWGRSFGGYLTGGEPVNMRLTGIFADSAGKTFSQIALQNLPQR